ncbi:hypothetical protein GOB87_04995 [Acetobacter estunensis]|uniref:DUF3325 domain-containing protein n=1 Tax=Acetobacter estunensis TaxID=104097 RepID=A0A967EBC2_9PROT|nr:hypothetical protein [Acetobacter estunensis]NHO53318.1 hypothetical protein [Acetobacter estunensis]
MMPSLILIGAELLSLTACLLWACSLVYPRRCLGLRRLQTHMRKQGVGLLAQCGALGCLVSWRYAAGIAIWIMLLSVNSLFTATWLAVHPTSLAALTTRDRQRT